jgi:hypothetical protein
MLMRRPRRPANRMSVMAASLWSQPTGRPSVGVVGRPQDHATAQSRPTERASTALRVTSGSHADRGAGQLASMPGQSTVYESEPADCWEDGFTLDRILMATRAPSSTCSSLQTPSRTDFTIIR